jgi:hypothetical protein
MGFFSSLAGLTGLYWLLPKPLREAAEQTARHFVARVVSAAVEATAGEGLTSAEERVVRRAVAKAVGLTLAGYPELDTVAFASDFRTPPLSNLIESALFNPSSVVTREDAEAAFEATPYDLSALGVDPVVLVGELREAFQNRLTTSRVGRDLWRTGTLARIASEMSVLVPAVQRVLEAVDPDVVGPQAPFRRADDFFSPWLGAGRVFTHALELVGRDSVLEELTAFLDRPGHGLGLLPGRGGIGKSRILLGWVKSIEFTEPGLLAVLLAEGTAFEAANLPRLPEAVAVIIVDDAHRREDLGGILRAVRSWNRPIKVLLATRPHGIDRLKATAVQGGYDPEEIAQFGELTGLEPEARVQLAREVLGAEFQHLAERLAEATRDSPLVTVVGGNLIAQRQVEPALLLDAVEFRDVVLTRFAQEYTDVLAERIDRPRAIALLRAVAATNPIRPDDGGWIQGAVALANLPEHEIRQALGWLEEAGVLLRRGGTLRITPDVVADHLLQEACITRAGDNTGYADEVFAQFRQTHLPEVLRNLAELDWRLGHGDRPPVVLLDRIWEQVLEDLREAGNYGRHELLERLRPVSIYQPQRVLALVRHVLENPLAEPEEDGRFFSTSWSHDRVLEGIPPLLRNVAYHPDLTAESCDLLWMLGRDDERDLGGSPDHAIRILRELAGYEEGRFGLANEVVSAVERWLANPDSNDHYHSPLDVVDPLLEKAGSRTQWVGNALQMSPFFVIPENTRGIRGRALDLIEGQAASDRLKVKLRAVKSLMEALRDPLGHFGSTPSDEVLEGWVPEQLQILEMLSGVAQANSEPLVHLSVFEAVQWQAIHGKTEEVRSRSQDVVTSLPHRAFPFLLTKQLTDKRFHLDILDEAEEEVVVEAGVQPAAREEGFVERQNREAGEVAEVFHAEYPDPADGFAFLSERLERIEEGGGGANPGHVIFEIASRSLEYGVALMELAISDPDSGPARFSTALLSAVSRLDPGTAEGMKRRCIDSGHFNLQWAVAGTLGSDLGEAPKETDILFLQELLSSEDLRLRKHALWALGMLTRISPEKAVRLAKTTPISSDQGLADDLCMALSRGSNDSYDHLDEEVMKHLLAEFAAIPELDEFWIERVLDRIAKEMPAKLVDMLLERIERGKDADPFKFDAIPRRLQLPSISDSPEQQDLLRRVRALALEPDYGVQRHLPGLFLILSDRFGDAGIEILREWIKDGGDAELRAVSLLLSDAPWTFVLDHSDLVVEILDRLTAMERDTREFIEGGLYRVGVSRGGSGPAGEPMPHDVRMRDEARRIVEIQTPGSIGARFYQKLVGEAQECIDRSRERA